MARVFLVLAAGVLAGALLADDHPAKCDLCGGSREVRCFLCDGKGSTSACTLCGGGGRATCLACNGAGQFACPFCGGTGRIGEQQLRCKGCNTTGKIACKQCQGGTVVCPECGGKAGGLTCLACNGKGALPCPACAPPGQRCDRCKGTCAVPCPLCNGGGRVRMICPSCGSRKGTHCDVCQGIGRIRCDPCAGSGVIDVATKQGAHTYAPCPTCGGQGWMPCRACGGKGMAPCAACTSLHGVGEDACPMCHGKKTVECPRCLITTGWRGKDAESGATLTILPCRGFEPMIAAWLKTHLGVDRTAWRVVVDARQAAGAFTLGGPSGLSFEASAGGAGDPLRHLHPLSDKALDDRFGDWLSQHGYRDFHARDSVAVEKGSVRTFICLGTLEKPTEIRLVVEKSPAAPTQLQAKNIGFDDWERACIDGGEGK